MSHTQPTPGPWHTQGRYIVPVDDGPSIGTATILKAPSLKKQPDYDAQGYANARLMAAAPDLLELLYRCLPFIEDANDDPCYKPDRVKALENQIKALLTQIDKG
jgi:hypothetical protein